MPITPSGLFPPVPYADVLSGYPFFAIYTDSQYITSVSGSYGSTGKIFETNTDLFLYRLGGILRLTDLDTFVYTAPDVSTMAETSEGILVTVTNDPYTLKARVKTAIHNAPFVSGWLNESLLSGYKARASVSDNTYIREVPTLVGNNLANTFPRIVRNDINLQPVGLFSKSDAGIPQVTPAIGQITVLEAV